MNDGIDDCLTHCDNIDHFPFLPQGVADAGENGVFNPHSFEHGLERFDQ